jgi:hypothetical protein
MVKSSFRVLVSHNALFDLDLVAARALIQERLSQIVFVLSSSAFPSPPLAAWLGDRRIVSQDSAASGRITRNVMDADNDCKQDEMSF